VAMLLILDANVCAANDALVSQPIVVQLTAL